MFAARNGHEAAIRALIKGGADPKLTNGDGATPTIIAIVNDRFDLAKTLVELGADPNDGSLYFAVDMHDATSDMRARDGSRLRADHDNTLGALDLVKFLLDRGANANDGSLYFAVDMHDATTDMRAHDGSRLRVDHPNQLTSLDLIAFLLSKGADPNKPFHGQIHNTTLCCDPEVNSSPFYRAAIAADVDAMKLLIAKGAKVDWSPAEYKKPGEAAGAAGAGGGRRGANGNVGKTASMMAMTGGRGAAFAAGPGFDRIGAPPFREPGTREPVEALKLLLSAGADPNAKAPDGATLLHQAVAARRTDAIRLLVEKGAKLDAVNKDNLTPLLLAEKPDPPLTAAQMQQDPGVYRPRRDKREDVIATLRELMKLGKDDPAPQPPPLPDKKDDKKPEKKAPVEPEA